jgi:hypothetical protein
VVKKYWKGAVIVTALRDVNMTVEDGEMLEKVWPRGVAAHAQRSGQMRNGTYCDQAVRRRGHAEMTGLGEAARQVAGGIGTLSRLSYGPDDELRGPADVRDVVSGLAVALSRTPEVLTQLAVFLELQNVRGEVARADGGDVGATVRAVSDSLHRASLDAEAMAAALDAALTHCQQLVSRDQPSGTWASSRAHLAPPSSRTAIARDLPGSVPDR